MALHSTKVICTTCQHPFMGIPSRTFLGFQKFNCPSCKTDIIYPLSSGYRTTYRVIVVLMLILSVIALTQGEIGFPGLVVCAMVYALIRDRKIQKEINHS